MMMVIMILWCWRKQISHTIFMIDIIFDIHWVCSLDFSWGNSLYLLWKQARKWRFMLLFYNLLLWSLFDRFDRWGRCLFRLLQLQLASNQTNETIQNKKRPKITFYSEGLFGQELSTKLGSFLIFLASF